MVKYMKASDTKIVKHVLKEAERGKYKGEDKELVPEDILAEHSAESSVSFVESWEKCFKLPSGGSGPRGGNTSGRGRGAGTSGSRGSRGSKSCSNSRSQYRARWGDLEGEALKEALTEAGVCFK